MINVSRRTFVLNALGAPLLARAELIDAPVSRSSPKEVLLTNNLAAWVDTLLPADGASPAASALGVHLSVAEAARDIDKQNQLLNEAVHWLDTEARRRYGARFSDLEHKAKEAIVRVAEAAPAGSLPRYFFLKTLNDAYIYYYSHPRSWAPLGYAGPPQPSGFPGFGGPPDSLQNDG